MIFPNKKTFTKMQDSLGTSRYNMAAFFIKMASDMEHGYHHFIVDICTSNLRF